MVYQHIGNRAGNLLVWSHLTLGPSFKVQRAYPNLKVLITRLLLVLDVAETTYITLFSSFYICKKDFIIFD